MDNDKGDGHDEGDGHDKGDGYDKGDRHKLLVYHLACQCCQPVC